MPEPDVKIKVRRVYVSVTQLDIGDKLIITQVRVICKKCRSDLLGEGEVQSWSHECDAGA